MRTKEARAVLDAEGWEPIDVDRCHRDVVTVTVNGWWQPKTVAAINNRKWHRRRLRGVKITPKPRGINRCDSCKRLIGIRLDGQSNLCLMCEESSK